MPSRVPGDSWVSVHLSARLAAACCGAWPVDFACSAHCRSQSHWLAEAVRHDQQVDAQAMLGIHLP